MVGDCAMLLLGTKLGLAVRKAEETAALLAVVIILVVIAKEEAILEDRTIESDD